MTSQNLRRRYKSISDGDFHVFSLITTSIGDDKIISKSQLIQVLVDYLQDNDQDLKTIDGKEREKYLENKIKYWKSKSGNLIYNAKNIHIINEDNNTDIVTLTDIGNRLYEAIKIKDSENIRLWYLYALMTNDFLRDLMIAFVNTPNDIGRSDIRHIIKHKDNYDIGFGLTYYSSGGLIIHNRAYRKYSIDKRVILHLLTKLSMHVIEKAYSNIIHTESQRYENLSDEQLKQLPLRFHVDTIGIVILNNDELNIFGLRHNLDVFLFMLKDSPFLDFRSSDASGASKGVFGYSDLSMMKVYGVTDVNEELLDKSTQIIKKNKLKLIWEI